MNTERRWWKESVVYQIYPRSFMDSNGDGIGDIKGIISRLDYIQELGATVIWLSPIYQSPNKDNGYDVSDYFKVMREFGTMEDVELLIEEVHKRDMKLMLDLVMNHTSDEHPWFIESRQSKESVYRDFYIWRKGTDGRPPNNWASMFGGSAWEYSEERGEYYLHLFGKHQPDLNWENPRVRRTLYDMIWWWADKGVDGFRMDVINCISKDCSFPSVGTEELADGAKYYENGPKVHHYLQEMNREVLARYDLITVGETGGVTPEDALQYAGTDSMELNMIFHFEHMQLDYGPDSKWDIVPWKLKDLISVMNRWQTELEGRAWNSLYFNNHDQPRIVSRYGNDKKYRVQSAKLFATMLHMMQGTPYIYQGEEIGMTNVEFTTVDEYRDLSTLQFYEEEVKKGRDPSEVLKQIQRRGRDNARTPMQWSGSEQAGFTTGEPWIQVNPNYASINVEAELSDENSILHYYRKLIALRKKHPIIVYGNYEWVPTEGKQLFVYRRQLTSQKLLVILNVSDQMAVFKWSEVWKPSEGSLILGNYAIQADYADAEVIELSPYEARVYGYQL
ncbi:MULTISPECIES: alpha-glucosidase [Paenibacillus]|uniref:alpha-glucosidase n=1 Tax=Paenibacillus TaxID=44249 RepID=UPI0022B8EBFE|nr:alpha-glucosidase [Paenibacillus caseinilyticus]MCZ8524140.1 alpha-glucosidase [Paenibacillus caseinilyticus]